MTTSVLLFASRSAVHHFATRFAKCAQVVAVTPVLARNASLPPFAIRLDVFRTGPIPIGPVRATWRVASSVSALCRIRMLVPSLSLTMTRSALPPFVTHRSWVVFGDRAAVRGIAGRVQATVFPREWPS